MEDVKQVIVVRKDVSLKKGELAAIVAKASMQFLLDNNQSSRDDEIRVNLTREEATWLTGSFANIMSADSEDALRELALRAQLEGIEVYPVTGAQETGWTCLAIGPDDESIINRLTTGLKTF